MLWNMLDHKFPDTTCWVWKALLARVHDFKSKLIDPNLVLLKC